MRRLLCIISLALGCSSDQNAADAGADADGRADGGMAESYGTPCACSRLFVSGCAEWGGGEGLQAHWSIAGWDHLETLTSDRPADAKDYLGHALAHCGAFPLRIGPGLLGEFGSRAVRYDPVAFPTNRESFSLGGMGLYHDPRIDLIATFGVNGLLLFRSSALVDTTPTPFATITKVDVLGVARDANDRLFVAIRPDRLRVVEAVSQQQGPIGTFADLDGNAFLWGYANVLATDDARLYVGTTPWQIDGGPSGPELRIYSLASVTQGAVPDVRIPLASAARQLELANDVLVVSTETGVLVFPSAHSLNAQAVPISISTGGHVRLSRKTGVLYVASGHVEIWKDITSAPSLVAALSMPMGYPTAIGPNYMPQRYTAFDVEVFEP